MDSTMSPRQEDKKEPVLGNSESSDEQEMEAEDDLVNEDDFDLEGKQYKSEGCGFNSRSKIIRDFTEIAALNENLDNLNAALDTIEQRADDMKEKVLQLLMSNREIMKELREEQKTGDGAGGSGSDKTDGGQCNHHPGKPADEA